MTTSRRSFLASATGIASAAGAGWLISNGSLVEVALAHAAKAVRQQPPPPLRNLTPHEGAELAAMAARIMPTTDTPGATEAGVIHFIDRALGAEQKGALPMVRRGLTDLRTRAARRRPGATSFASLSPDDQDAILLDIEKGDFFQGIRFATMVGMFGDPAHGGNRNGVGWKLLGFEHRPSYKAPFGWYDAEAAKGR